jgi:hypothetical protein
MNIVRLEGGMTVPHAVAYAGLLRAVWLDAAG